MSSPSSLSFFFLALKERGSSPYCLPVFISLRISWEQEVDTRLNRLRSRMVKDLAQQSEASNWSDPQDTNALVYPKCGGTLRKRSKHQREIQSSGGSRIHLDRQFAHCTECGYSFFSLDRELKLERSGLTPHAHECLVRLGAWMPFVHAAEELEAILGVQVSQSTVRRLTEEAGKLLCQQQPKDNQQQ